MKQLLILVVLLSSCSVQVNPWKPQPPVVQKDQQLYDAINELLTWRESLVKAAKQGVKDKFDDQGK